jgi:oxygen-independent coproporphyrinogen-3 oxidase
MAGIYIHIPFCKQACSYCDFHFSTTFTKYRQELINSICQEIKKEQQFLEQKVVDTIYFGGGTPSLLKLDEIEQILSTIYENFERSNNPEITLEANPDDIDEHKLEDWKRIGVNRLSIGLQSFHQEDLSWMNRAHTAEESRTAVELAKKHGFNFTIDLIYGLPNSNLNLLENNLTKAVSLSPDHISAYCLTIEQKTALHKWVENGKISVADEDEQADQFSFLVDFLSSHGFHQYEISNFAKENAYSRHNSNYWKGVHYLGVGPSAHSFNGISRRWNIANNKGYINKINKGTQHYETESLTPEDQFNERLMTGLRTTWGVQIEKLKRLRKLEESFLTQLSTFEKMGLLSIKNETIMLTEAGKLQADHIAATLFV